MSGVRFFRFFRYLNWETLKKTFVCALKRRLIGLSSEIAYSAMLALFPAILAVLIAIGLLADSVQYRLNELAVLLKDIVPEQVWVLLLNFVRGIKLTNYNWFSLSFVAAIWIASGALGATMNALDQIERVPSKKRRPFWQAKLISLVLTIGTILLLIVASFLVLLGDLAIKVAFEQNWRSVLLIVWKLLSGPVIFAIATTAAALIYQIIQVYVRKKRIFWKFEWILLVLLSATAILLVIDFLLMYLRNLILTPEINQQVRSIILNVWQLLSWPVALGIVVAVFASIYRFGPSRWIRGTPILPGAILAAISWAILSATFRLYVSNFGNYNKVYGAVGTVIVLMLWLQMGALVMLLGFQLNITVGEAIKNQMRKYYSEKHKKKRKLQENIANDKS